jgi:hypothetical protein
MERDEIHETDDQTEDGDDDFDDVSRHYGLDRSTVQQILNRIECGNLKWALVRPARSTESTRDTEVTRAA